MRRLLILLLCCFGVSGVLAQGDVPTIVEAVRVDLWPDYDDPSLLVLVTGDLGTTATLPAVITVPLPEGARLNAVARITEDDVMTDDVAFDEVAQGVRITLPDRRFRLEYYVPYIADGNDRSFAFTWLADFDVEQLNVVIQQPLAAEALNIVPDVETTETEQGGLQYYNLLPQQVVAREPFSFVVQYRLSAETLSAAQLLTEDETIGTITAVPEPQTRVNWGLLLTSIGGFLIGVAILWQVLVNNQRPRSARPRKPAPARQPTTSGKAKFCHHCGQPVQAGDQFCRACGTKLKGA